MHQTYVYTVHKQGGKEDWTTILSPDLPWYAGTLGYLGLYSKSIPEPLHISHLGITIVDQQKEGDQQNEQ